MKKLFTILLLGIAVACQGNHSSGFDSRKLDIKAGPEYLTRELAPPDAPFPMAGLTLPVFPDRKSEVGLSLEMNAAQVRTAIQSAIDSVASCGGGTVCVPKGVWPSGRLELKSNVNLHLQAGAELHFSGDIKDYLPVVLTRDEGIDLYSLGACIYAIGQRNIALTGPGRIVGPDTDCEIYKRNSRTTIDAESTIMKSQLSERVYDGEADGPVFLPKTFAPYECTSVFVEGVTLDRGLFWNVAPQYCDSVIVRGVTVRSFGHGRTDGIDLDSCRDVLVEYCSLDCQDDCYTIKSGRSDDGIDKGRPSERILIRNCLALRGAGGLVCGSETAGGIRNVYMRDCVFDGTTLAFRFKSRRTRGGGIENVYVERVKADLLKDALCSDMLGSEKWVGDLAKRYPQRPVNRYTPYLRNISIHDVEIENCRALVKMDAVPELKGRNVFFGNVTAKCESPGSVMDIDKFSLKDVRIRTADTSAFVLDRCGLASFFGFSNLDRECPVRVDTIGECPCLNVQNYPLHPVKYTSIRPGEVWLDTEGKPIQAHGFQVTFIDGKYYWYGEDKSETLFGTNNFFCGVRCYSSTDFYNWKDEGDIILPSEDPGSFLHRSQKLERPHIVFCRETGKYVCWLKFQNQNGHFVIMQSDSFLGPYEFVRNLKPQGYGVGDFDMYTDPDTGKSYVWFERPHWEYICCTLTPDCTDVTDEYSEHFVGLRPPLTREAAAHFVAGGRHYMFTSGTTSYTPNPSEVAVFDDYHSDYEVLGDPHPGDRFAHSFCSQITSVIKIPGKDLYVAMADRWEPHTFNTDIPARTYLSFLDRYKNHKPSERDFSEPRLTDRRYTLVSPSQDVYKATYVFLPIVFRDGMPLIEWKDEWTLDSYR